MKKYIVIGVMALVLLGMGCAQITKANVPSDIYMTTGDGIKNKDYKPLGVVYAVRAQITVSCLGLFPPYLPQVGPVIEKTLKDDIAKQAKEMGADGIINLEIGFLPANVYGLIVVTYVYAQGTAVKIK